MKKLVFANAKVTSVEEPTPSPRFSRTNSLTGLSSLSKSVIAHENHIEEIDLLLKSTQDVIQKYEMDIQLLNDNIKNQEGIIESQRTIMKDYKNALDGAINDLHTVKGEIDSIWNN